jgi:EmrB/QacA subfamily drug resistance transporter
MISGYTGHGVHFKPDQERMVQVDQPASTSADAAQTRWILPATILGSSLSFIDSSVVNVALPAMQRDLHASLATMQWVVNGYMLMLASLILPGGSSGDRFGRRHVFLIGLCAFVLASLACALAPGTAWLIIARLVQGIAAALLVPASLAIIGAAFSGAARGRAIGTWAGAAALTTALGPPLGGWLVDTISWRAIFYINIPIGALAALFALRIPSDRQAAQQTPLDLGGALLAVVSLGLLCDGLITLGRRDRVTGCGELVAAIAAVACFIRFEHRARAPMMPLTLFHNRAFSGVNALTVLLYAAVTGALFLLPFVFINARGYSASAAGAAFLPFAVIMGLGSRSAGALGARFGAGPPMTVGACLTGVGFALLALCANDASYWSGTLPGILIIAVGMTIAVAPLTTAVFDSSPVALSGIASGINNTAARAGGLIAVAALGLAFGTTGAASIPAATLIAAYRLVLLVAAGIAGLGGLIAALTVRRN